MIVTNDYKISSNIDEVVRSVLNFLFFYDEISSVQKSIKKNTRHNQYIRIVWGFLQDKVLSTLNTSKQDFISNVALKSI